MSIQTELTRITNAKAAIKTAIEGKGVTVPDGTLLDGMAALIEAIEAAGGADIGGHPFFTGTITPAENTTSLAVAPYGEVVSALGISSIHECVCIWWMEGNSIPIDYNESYAALAAISYDANSSIRSSIGTVTYNSSSGYSSYSGATKVYACSLNKGNGLSLHSAGGNQLGFFAGATYRYLIIKGVV